MTNYNSAQRDVNFASGNIYINNSAIIKAKSIIADIVNFLSNENLPIETNTSIKLPMEVQAKIKLNHLDKCKYIIETYKPLSSYLNKAYQSLNEVKTLAKHKVLLRLKNMYFEELSKYLDSSGSRLKAVQLNANDIFMSLRENVRNIVISSINNTSTEEEIDIAINVILADAFVNCQIIKVFKNLDESLI